MEKHFPAWRRILRRRRAPIVGLIVFGILACAQLDVFPGGRVLLDKAGDERSTYERLSAWLREILAGSEI